MTYSTVAPGMPTGVTATATSDTEITVTWESPADNGGADITGYMVQSAYMGADDMMSEWMDVDPAHMGMDMMYMDTGLMPDTTYYYHVAAMNAVGMGEYSDGMAMATTEATNMAPTAGADIADQTVMAGGTVMVQSTITDADAGDTLTWSVMSSMPTYATATVDTMGMVTITGVAEGIGHHHGDRHRRGRRDGYARHHGYGYGRSGGHDADGSDRRNGHG